jgi:hypothetical protein
MLRFCCLSSPSEPLLLIPIVRTGFQFVGFAGVAVEVNDLLFAVAFFRHSVSPSENSDAIAPELRRSVERGPLPIFSNSRFVLLN